MPTLKTTRREFLAKMGAGAVSASLAACVTTGKGPRAMRPNIMIIMADDMGFSDIGCYGGEIETPNLDRLAAQGLRFTQFYNAARCCPTRASLLTGLFPHQAGVGKMITRGKFEPGPYQGFLNDRCVTIAEALRPAGYRTYMSGKWHVGEMPGHWPRTRGFDRYFGLISGASSYYELLSPRRAMALDDKPYTPPNEGFYMTDAFTDHALRCIEEHEKDQPFFHYVAYTAPHWPLHAPREVVEKYIGRYRKGWDQLREERYERLVKMGIIRPEWALSPRDEGVPPWEDVRDAAEDWDLRMAVYAAMVDRMDWNIGRLLDALEAKGVMDNTLILFLSDNGGCHEGIEGDRRHKKGVRYGDRGSFVAYKRPWANASNTPFRLFKHWVHEGGCSTPLIAHWPKVIHEGGGLTHEAGHVIDLMATCVDVAGATYPETFNGKPVQPMEGRSLLPVLRGGRWQTPRQFAWEHFGNRALRDGDWKLVARRNGPWALYHLAEDRTELHDRIEDEPGLAESLRKQYAAWAARVGV